MFRQVLLGFVIVTQVLGQDETITQRGPVTTSQSGVFRGSWMQTRRGRQFQSYRGIRYAEPPVGELRFQPPKLILSYPEPVDASKDGSSCPRPASPGYDVNEDCLTINIYTPDNNSSRLFPVIFYIHAGGYYSLSGRSDVAGPQYLLERDLVLVTINYRLGTLGFLSTGDEYAPGNNGFKDQVAALKWVQLNIMSFGGDPNLVTIAGCSAGSRSVMLHMISPMSKGLFHHAIGISGSPTSVAYSPHDLRHLAVRQAELVNCPTNTSRALIDCLKTKPWKELGDSLRGFFEFGFDPVLLWQPVVELDFGQERFLTQQPIDAIIDNKMHAVPFLVSQSEGEFFWKAFTILNNATLLNRMNDAWDKIAPISFQLPRENATVPVRRFKEAYLGDKPLANDTDTAKGLGTLYGDAVTGFSVHRMANLMARFSPKPVYYYKFNYIGNQSHYVDPVTNKPIDVAHMDDLIYLFTMSYRFTTIPLDSADSAMLDKMTALWYNFARYGDPNPRLDTPELGFFCWPEMKPDNRKYMSIGTEFCVEQKLHEERFVIWEELYPLSKLRHMP